MTDLAQNRRSPWLCRFFVSPTEMRLEPPRQLSGWFMPLSGRAETSHAIPGLQVVLMISERAAHVGVLVQTIRDLRHARRGSHGFRVRREMRYRVSEVQRWVAAMEPQNQAAHLAVGPRR